MAPFRSAVLIGAAALLGGATTSQEQLPTAIVGVPYVHAMSLKNPDKLSLTYSATGLPLGLTMTPDGRISGVPARDGDVIVSVFVAGSRSVLSGSFRLSVKKAVCPPAKPHELTWCDQLTKTDAGPTLTARKDLKKQRYTSPNVEMSYFDRRRNEMTSFGEERLQEVNNQSDLVEVAAIAGSKAMLSGTVLRHKNVKECGNYDWTTEALTFESSSVSIYGPQDVSIFCQDNGQATQDLMVVLPVRAIWAEIYGFKGDLNDPMRTAPSNVAPSPYSCESKSTNVHPDSQASVQNLTPCDVNANWFRHALYDSAGLYNVLTQPNVWTGSLSFSPVVIQGGSQSLTYDLQGSVFTKLGNGWIGLPVAVEKASTAAANFDSITAYLTYMMRADRTKPWWRQGDWFGFRPTEISFSAGPEIAPTRHRDLNFVGGFLARQPIVLTALKQPSWITFFPVAGVQGGEHINTHIADENSSLLRGIVGADTSVRWPFHAAPNFISTKPITLTYSYRTSWLGSAEPYTDVSHGGTEQLSLRRRSFSRITYSEPLSSYLSFQASFLKGSLPPDWRSQDYTLVLGVSLASSGMAEH